MKCYIEQIGYLQETIQLNWLLTGNNTCIEQ